MEKPNDAWVITRRDFLPVSGLAALGLALASPAPGAEKAPAPLLRFGMVTDPHYADRKPAGTRHYRESLAKMTECVTFMNEQKVDFLIELGDLKDQASPATEASTLTFLETIEKAFGAFKGPRYHVLGNHDMDSLSKQQFLAGVTNTGIPKDTGHYAFDAKEVRFLVLDANCLADGSDYDHGNFKWNDANIPPAQVDWLKQELAATTKPVVVFVHQQLDDKDDEPHTVNQASKIRRILQDSGRVLAAFHGHNHPGRHRVLEGIHYYTLKAMVEGSGADNSSYAIVDVHPDFSMTVTGYRHAADASLPKA